MPIARVKDGNARCDRLEPNACQLPVSSEFDHVHARYVRRRRDVRPEAAERGRRDAEQIEHDVDQQQPGPEAGQGDARHRNDAPEMVDQRFPVQRRQHAQRHAEQQRQQQAGQCQFQRCRQALEEILQHRAPGGGAFTQIAVQQPDDIAFVLHRYRLIEPHLAFDRLEVFRRGEGTGLHQRRIARQHHRQQEADQGHAEQRGYHQGKASQHIPAERHAAPIRSASSRRTARTCPNASRCRQGWSASRASNCHTTGSPTPRRRSGSSAPASHPPSASRGPVRTCWRRSPCPVPDCE